MFINMLSLEERVSSILCYWTEEAWLARPVVSCWNTLKRCCKAVQRKNRRIGEYQLMKYRLEENQRCISQYKQRGSSRSFCTAGMKKADTGIAGKHVSCLSWRFLRIAVQSAFFIRRLPCCLWKRHQRVYKIVDCIKCCQILLYFSAFQSDVWALQLGGRNCSCLKLKLSADWRNGFSLICCRKASSAKARCRKPGKNSRTL